ncbi:MAG: glycosyltransferase [Pseudomonadota bacterium]
MTLPSVSVIVVSRGRPEALALCLTGVSQLQYPMFEVVVVADPDGIAAVQRSPVAASAKAVPFDQPNISAARNAGVDQAAGEVVAFIDDDAVPEPTWLTHLCTPFAQSDIAASGGYVRARNGISYQWTARRLDRLGFAHPLHLSGDTPQIVRPGDGLAVKTEGTNMAIRRNVLVDLGGFDPAFRFFLDETDVNMRLARAGYATAIVPLAQVHHGFAASERRRSDRVPRDLTEIGASWAVFQRKHTPPADHQAHTRRVRADERRRALGLMVSGLIEPQDVRRLMRSFDVGYAAGAARTLAPAALQTHATQPLFRHERAPGQHQIIAARGSQAEGARADALAAVKSGQIVTLLLLSRSSLYHQARFHPDGYWEQIGGVFGKSVRAQPMFRPWRFAARVTAEAERITRVRGAARVANAAFSTNSGVKTGNN